MLKKTPPMGSTNGFGSVQWKEASGVEEEEEDEGIRSATDHEVTLGFLSTGSFSSHRGTKSRHRCSQHLRIAPHRFTAMGSSFALRRENSLTLVAPLALCRPMILARPIA
jgi:hypothetical protein